MSLHRSTIKIQGESQGLVLYLNKLFLDNQKPTVPLDQGGGGAGVFGVHDLMHLPCYQESYCFPRLPYIYSVKLKNAGEKATGESV